MTLNELVDRLKAIQITTTSGSDIVAEHSDMGVGGNVKSEIVDVVIENGQVVLITDHAV